MIITKIKVVATIMEQGRRYHQGESYFQDAGSVLFVDVGGNYVDDHDVTVS